MYCYILKLEKVHGDKSNQIHLQFFIVQIVIFYLKVLRSSVAGLLYAMLTKGTDPNPLL